tara:strand:- start:312 stop:587 length:276 start_codon:yes stop_codon:yes gene_type:complete
MLNVDFEAMRIRDKYDRILSTYVGMHDRDELIDELLSLHSVSGTLKSQRFNDAEELTEWVNENNIEVVSITDHQYMTSERNSYKKIVMYYR